MEHTTRMKGSAAGCFAEVSCDQEGRTRNLTWTGTVVEKSAIIGGFRLVVTV